MDPSEETIESVIAIACLDPVADRTAVVNALKDKNGNAEAVIGAYYDNPDRFQATYALVHSDIAVTNGAATANTITSNTRSSSTARYKDPSAIRGFSPPSTPSRSSSPVSTGACVREVGDWIAETRNASYGVEYDQSEEDKDLARALAMSLESSSLSDDAPTAENDQTSTTKNEPSSTALIHLPTHSATSPTQPRSVGTAHAETGVGIGSQAPPKFGPAVRPSYSEREWGLTLVSAKPENQSSPGHRRTKGCPGVLVGTDTEYLNAVLVILHSISSVRNAFLQLGGMEPMTYGSGPSWWSGTRIPPLGKVSSIRDLDATDKPASEPDFEKVSATPSESTAPMVAFSLDPSNPSSREFVEELRRLMAFLDASERAHASTDSLANSFIMQSMAKAAHRVLNEERYGSKVSGDDATRRFLTVLSAFSDTELEKTLETRAKLEREGAKPNVGSETISHWMLEAGVGLGGTPALGKLSLPITSVYSVLDNIFWPCFHRESPRAPTADGSASSGGYWFSSVEKLAPVQIIKIQADYIKMAPGTLYGAGDVSAELTGLAPGQTRFYIPKVLRMDRYLSENREFSIAIQDNMRVIMSALWRLTHEVQGRRGSRYDVQYHMRLKQSAMARLWYYKARILQQRTDKATQRTGLATDDTEMSQDDDLGRNGDFCVDMIDGVTPQTPAEIREFDRLRAEIAVAHRCIAYARSAQRNIVAQRKALWQMLSLYRNTGTDRDTSATPPPTVAPPYKLTGIIINSSRYYSCSHVQTLATDEDTEDTTSAHQPDRHWWQTIKRQSGTIHTQRTSVEFAITDAQRALAQSKGEAVLIYCTDEAWNASKTPLSKALQTFLRHDNCYLKAAEAQPAIAGPSSADAKQLDSPPATPTETKKQPSEDYEDTRVADTSNFDETALYSAMHPIQRRVSRSDSIDSMSSNFSERTGSTAETPGAFSNEGEDSLVYIPRPAQSSWWNDNHRGGVEHVEDTTHAPKHDDTEIADAMETTEKTSEAADAMETTEKISGAADAMETTEKISEAADAMDTTEETTEKTTEVADAMETTGETTEAADAMETSEETTEAADAMETTEETTEVADAMDTTEETTEKTTEVEKVASERADTNDSEQPTEPMRELEKPPTVLQRAEVKDGALITSEAKENPPRGVKLEADWDNPEGRYVPE